MGSGVHLSAVAKVINIIKIYGANMHPSGLWLLSAARK
jgi:hypothetical protein